ncbi:hypothetical protein [Roseovarius salinarum]|uniref:hypothetical protein n=1 Tax=Roseovarius salinarum TaxID=1981892 RepID=UPI000C333D52|nr:hypothetical protein [Roseovarius salinarum]
MLRAIILTAGACAAAAPAAAETQQGKARLIACYQRVVVPAQYEETKVKIKEPVRKYIKRNGRIELVEYPAIYRVDRKLVKEEHVEMQEIPCN